MVNESSSSFPPHTSLSQHPYFTILSADMFDYLAFLNGVGGSLTATAVVHATKRFAAKTPRTAACRCDGVQYRL